MEAAPFAVSVFVALWLAVAGLLVAMGVTDGRTRRIPNWLVAGVAVAWALMQLTSCVAGVATGATLAEAAQAVGVPSLLLPLFSLPSPAVGLLAALCAVIGLAGANALYERVFAKQAMGAGDVKLIGALALFLGPVPTLVCLMLACLFALAAALPARQRTFPFAPALIVAFICVFFIEL